MNEYTAKDFKKGQPRWCPGCGDHFFLASLHKAMAELGVAPHDTAVISGIGCSSRLPYYMNTYAMQTVHGRAAAISTGCKVANPKITVADRRGRRCARRGDVPQSAGEHPPGRHRRKHGLVHPGRVARKPLLPLRKGRRPPLRRGKRHRPVGRNTYHTVHYGRR